MRMLVLLLLSLYAAAVAAEDQYLPLSVGNRWEYASGHTFDILTTEDGAQFLLLPKTGELFSPVTLEPIYGDSVLDYASVVHSQSEFVFRPDSEFTIEVLGERVIEGRRYFEISDGSALRYASDGRLMEFVNGAEERVALDVPSILENPGETGYWGWSSLFSLFITSTSGGFPSSGVAWAPLYTRIGAGMTDWITVGYSSADGGCGMTLAAGIGIVESCCGNDTHSGCTQLLEAEVGGSSIRETVIEISNWGKIKLR